MLLGSELLVVVDLMITMTIRERSLARPHGFEEQSGPH